MATATMERATAGEIGHAVRWGRDEAAELMRELADHGLRIVRVGPDVTCEDDPTVQHEPTETE